MLIRAIILASTEKNSRCQGQRESEFINTIFNPLYYTNKLPAGYLLSDRQQQTLQNKFRQRQHLNECLLYNL